MTRDIVESTILWRRLDAPGHDACRLLRRPRGGWRLDGTAVLLDDGVPARLSYLVDCDDAWRTRRGRVHGWRGADPIALDIRRGRHGWRLDGRPVPGLETCLDLDLRFTPATNLLPLRRLALTPGQAADAPAAWLDLTSSPHLTLLPQRYERRSPTTVWYEAPTVPYAALLELTAEGWVQRYGELWEEVGTTAGV